MTYSLLSIQFFKKQHINVLIKQPKMFCQSLCKVRIGKSVCLPFEHFTNHNFTGTNLLSSQLFLHGLTHTCEDNFLRRQ